jgi:predicted transcriptional regulator
MTDKDTVLEILRKLPEDTTLEEMQEELAILAAIRRGEEAADAGYLIPHEEVIREIGQLISSARQKPELD